MRFAVTFFALGLGWLSASAQLTWERTRAEFHPEPAATKVVATYPFRNDTAATIEVLELHSSCGCTVPELEKRKYAPGESGVLTATFSIESREGLQQKQIIVQTDAGETMLELIAHLPVRLEMQPRMLTFREGEEGAKIAKLNFRSNTPVTDVAIANAGSGFEVELVTLREGHDYEVKVTPKEGLGGNVTSTVVVRSTGASGAKYFDSLFLRRTR